MDVGIPVGDDLHVVEGDPDGDLEGDTVAVPVAESDPNGGVQVVLGISVGPVVAVVCVGTGV